jgi:hypothetical protein
MYLVLTEEKFKCQVNAKENDFKQSLQASIGKAPG